ncbi:hypothetical protein [Ktedonospora formicarum]|uniref:Uncharacterized protein n=1 Tax=Ktedonospora formicarum TaxID=2778364 RepID=A0A8J3MSD6_9CHLR|nr:hypothetical protein [Ktedonospora formicarum]GHO46000.1 hypothetical protein KSX_41630 [Ktedonospora formicarum]
MERNNAERVFTLVAEIGGDIRGRIISERWWLIWIVMGIQILLTNSITQLLLWNGEHRSLIYIGLWGLHILLIPPIIFFIHRRSGGQRTTTETFIWWIWTTFILAATCTGLFNEAVGLPLFFNAPILSLLAAVAFSMMAMVTHRYFLIHAVVFLATMIAMSAFPQAQFVIYGGCWCLALVALGIYYRLTIVPHPARQL